MAWFRHREAAPVRAAASSCEERQGSVSEVHPDVHRCALEALEGRTLLAVSLPPGFEQSVWTRGLTVPTAQEFTPDGRLFITEKAGAVRVVTADGELLDKPFVTVPAKTNVDRGLVSIAIDPDFEENGYIYLWYTIEKSPNDTWNRLARFQADESNANVAADDSEEVLLESPMEGAIHTGGMMHFGADGMLYLGVGDGGSPGRGQRLNELRGKVLRLDVANYPDSIVPEDNPFVGEAGARGEIWALGLRNPFSGGIDPVTGKVFVNDVGWESFEEVNHVTVGKNYGWPLAEGPSTDSRFVNPIYSYAKNNTGAAVTGGLFYRGNAFPASYNGTYFFADYLRGWIKRLDPNNGNEVTDFATGAEGPLDLDIGPDGSVYYLSAFGNGFTGENRPVYKVSFVGGNNRKPTAVASASATNGELPLKVKFTGSRSSDPDGDSLTYSWDFGDGSAPVTDANPIHRYTEKGRYRVRLTVNDGRGGVARAETITVLAGFEAPTAKIRIPKGSLRYVAGDVVRFAGIGSDEEDGRLKKKQFEWTVVFVHADHTHEFKPSILGTLTGKFRTATSGETDPNQGYRVTLTVTDSHGLTATDSVLIQPKKANVTIRANVPGLKFALDGKEFTTRTEFVGVAGLEREIAAPETQMLDGEEYIFTGWSDDGEATHIARMPLKDTVYTARYVKAPSGGGTPDGDGLAATYFDKANFSGAELTRIDETIDFTWGKDAPIDGIDADSFSARWFGQIEPEFSEIYTFFATADDGVRLTVNDKVIIDALDARGLEEHIGKIKLTAGERYDIQLEYVEREGRAVARLSWQSESTPKQIVPRERLFAAAPEAEQQQQQQRAERQRGLQLLAAKSVAPKAPTKLVAEARSHRSIRLTWRDNARDETGFRLYRKAPGQSDFSLLAKLPRNTRKYTDESGVQGNASHSYKLRALNNAKGSAYAKVTVKTPAAPNPNPEPEPFTEFTIAWESAANAPIGRHEAVGTTANGKLYLFGGFTPTLRQITDAHVYDPTTDAYTELADVPEPLTHGSAVFDDNDKIYVAGFFEGVAHGGDGSHNVHVYNISTDTWTLGPALPARQGAAVMVKVGRNLHFFGGADPGRKTNSTGHWVLDLDNPDGGWTPRASMPNPRDHLAAAELDGKIYAIGGVHFCDDLNYNQSDVHAYDPATDTWTQVASLPFPWSHASSSTFTYGGKIITIGGQTNGRLALKHVAAYDPETNIWSYLQGLPSARKSPVAGVIGNSIILQGGEGRGPEPTTWIGRIVPLEPAPPLPPPPVETPIADATEAPVMQRALATTKPRTVTMPRSLGEVAAGVIDGKIYAVGEFNSATVVHNPKKNKFASSLARRPFQGHHHGAEVYNGKLYLIGGLGSGAGKVQIYDPKTNAWSLGADMPFAAGSVSTAQIGSKIFAAGGIVGSRTTNLAAKYVPATNRWKMIAPMPAGRNHAASGTDGKRFYVFGGRGAGSGDGNSVANGYADVQVYDPKTDTWTLKTPLPQARGGTGKAVFANGEFYVMGGETLTGAGATEHRVYDRVDVYDPKTDTWRSGRRLLTARHGIFPVLHDGVIYLPGGGVHAGASHSNILEVYPL